MSIQDILIELNFASSRREVREFIKNNAVSINGSINETITDTETTFSSKIAFHNKYLFLRRGKKSALLLLK